MEQLKINNYDELLMSIIMDINKNRNKYPKKGGAEGYAYFIGDKYVVKQLTEQPCQNKNFETYCMDMNYFAEAGYSVPKIYAWMIVPPGTFENDSHNRYYILEEQIRGKPATLGDVSEKHFSGICSWDEYENSMNSSDKTLYHAVLVNYLKDLVSNSQEFANIPLDELERFIYSDYMMHLEGIYGIPDVHGSNVIFGDNKITLIDNMFRENYKDCSENVKNMIMNNVLHLAGSFAHGLRRANKVPMTDEVKKLKQELYDANIEILKRVILSTNKLLKPRLVRGNIEANNMMLKCWGIAPPQADEISEMFLQK